ncbi:hypothetical protein CCAX7_14880 [Capsulimonas corticalis]|uniref:Uncharacterized protein n=1 Tax=Capsulimonas corticalis TaxID=2219043 RepID=A0A402CZF3_9BACT|nr:hypothetical protein [Capsulimonas corticalis]BDI29437.1 hypothetical protein CCAX7_14880 [Capsulimonas corticalis]
MPLNQQPPNEDERLNQIVPPLTPAPEGDETARQEHDEFDQIGLQSRIEEVVTKHLANLSETESIESRREFKKKLYKITKWWLAGVIGVLVASGFKQWTHFSLSDNVLIALITTTTISVIALFKTVMEYIFPTGSLHINTPQDADETKK